MQAALKRAAGVLLPVSSLWDEYGIGTFGEEAYHFVEQLSRAGQKYWQVLPIGPTSYGDSPYQSYSAFAGNQYFIDPETLVKEGLLYREEIEAHKWGDTASYVSYDRIYSGRTHLLRVAYDRALGRPIPLERIYNGIYDDEEQRRSQEEGYVAPAIRFPDRYQDLGNYCADSNGADSLQENVGAATYAGATDHTSAIPENCYKLSREYLDFCENSSHWLDDFVLYCALKDHFHGKSWMDWDEDIKRRTPEALERYRKLLADDMDFYRFVQFEFYREWHHLKQYANDRGIEIIGDIPLYMALDSADVWADPRLFLLSEDLVPTVVAGCPPDAFSADGQLWGNPIYDWEAHKAEDFAWWRRRMKANASLYDVIRVDHFIGIVRYYKIPWGDTDGRRGEFAFGPGEELTRAMDEAVGGKKIIAEDLGIMIPEVKALLAKTGYPGMRVLQFAFDGNPENDHLPYEYDRNSVAYCDTHDNETLMGYAKTHPEDYRRLCEYFHIKDMYAEAAECGAVLATENIITQVIRWMYASCASVVILSAQDLLGLGNEARINLPSSTGDNWKWRLAPGEMNDEVFLRMKVRKLAEVYGRV